MAAIVPTIGLAQWDLPLEEHQARGKGEISSLFIETIEAKNDHPFLVKGKYYWTNLTTSDYYRANFIEQRPEIVKFFNDPNNIPLHAIKSIKEAQYYTMKNGGDNALVLEKCNLAKFQGSRCCAIL